MKFSVALIVFLVAYTFISSAEEPSTAEDQWREYKVRNIDEIYKFSKINFKITAGI